MKTKQELKQTITNFKPTEEQIKNTEEVFLNMANVDTIKPIVLKYQIEILKKYKFQYKRVDDRKRFLKETGLNYIINPEHTYLIKESDFKIYLSEVAKEHLKNGFIVKKDYCPLLIAEDDLRKSQDKIIKSFESVTGIKKEDLFKNFPKNLNSYIDLTLRFMVKFIRNKDEILKDYKRAC